jgi:hypothetical protein
MPAPPGVGQALDTVVVGEQRLESQLELHADLQVGGQRSLDDLAEHNQALVGEFDRRDGERCERIRRRVRGRWRVAVLRVAPHLAAARQGDGFEHVAVAGGVRAVIGPRREHVGAALRALAADQVG